MATAYSLVDFLNNEIKKDFSREKAQLNNGNVTNCMFHVLSLAKHLGILEDMTTFDAGFINQSEMEQMKQVILQSS